MEKCINLSDSNIKLDSKSIADLSAVLKNKEVDIVVAGQLLVNWTNGAVKKHIVFEHTDGFFTPTMFPPPQEPPPFNKQRWNPFFGYVLTTQVIAEKIPKAIANNPDKLLQFSIENGLHVKIEPNIIASQKNKIVLSDVISLK